MRCSRRLLSQPARDIPGLRIDGANIALALIRGLAAAAKCANFTRNGCVTSTLLLESDKAASRLHLMQLRIAALTIGLLIDELSEQDDESENHDWGLS